MRRYVVTTAQAATSPHKKFLESIETYAEHNNSEIIILPTYGMRKSDDHPTRGISHLRQVTKDLDLNNHLKLKSFSVRPQAINPLTGLDRFAQKDTSMILPSPKQRMKVVPNSNETLPKMLWTTGAITYPRYDLKHRVNQIAQHDHVYGALAVTIKDDEIYHIRNLRASTNGRFVDLDTVYDGKEIKKERPAALVLGDWHTYDTDPTVREVSFGMIEQYKPERLVLHDLFNGHSITHHDRNKIGTLTKKHRQGISSLEEELSLVADELETIVDRSGEAQILIPACNHHDFLKKWLQHGNYASDRINSYIGAKLYPEYIDGKDPVKAGIELFYDIPDNVHFLRRDEDYKYRGVQLAVHGDKGPNGYPRLSPKSAEKAYGKVMYGHSHTPELLRDVTRVGTSTKTRLPYTQGPSSWMHTHGFLHKNGKSQLVNIIDGEYGE